MHLNKTNARWLGVCAGLADWLDVPATLVRVVFIICAISWPTFILGYFLLYFCLDKDITPERMQDYFRNAKTADHFRKLNYRKPIYKNQSNKRIAGVCSGIADYLDVSPFVVRVVTLLSLFVFGPFTFWAYIICIFVFDPDPNAPRSSNGSERYARRMGRRARRKQRRQDWKETKRRWRYGYKNEEHKASTSAAADDQSDADYEASEQAAAQDEVDAAYSRDECTAIFSKLEQRLREIEAYMTSKKFRLHCEINRI